MYVLYVDRFILFVAMIIGCIQQVLLKCKVYHIIDDAYICIYYVLL